MAIREFYLDVPGILLSFKYNNIVEPDIQYRYGRKVYLLTPGHYQLIFHKDYLDKMSIHIRQKCVNYSFEPNYKAVDIIITKNLMAFRKPEYMIKININKKEG
jgi:hypothetical protein